MVFLRTSWYIFIRVTPACLVFILHILLDLHFVGLVTNLVVPTIITYLALMASHSATKSSLIVSPFLSMFTLATIAFAFSSLIVSSLTRFWTASSTLAATPLKCESYCSACVRACVRLYNCAEHNNCTR